MIDQALFSTESIRRSGREAAVTAILAAAVDSADPYRAVLNHLACHSNRFEIGSRIYPLDQVRSVRLVAFGKAADPMARAAAVLGEHISAGIVISKDGYAQENDPSIHPRIRVRLSSHPVPDERSIAASVEIRNLLRSSADDELILCLISGGGSALVADPVPGVSLPDLQALTHSLLASGATIQQINCLRKHLDQIKGGGLARLALPARVATLLLSDVVGDALDVIASGPTVPDQTTYADALKIIHNYGLEKQVSPNILAHLREGSDGKHPETPKPGDIVFENVEHTIIASNQTAVQAAAATAHQVGFQTRVITTQLQGEASAAGKRIAEAAARIHSGQGEVRRPACLIAGGETTVSLRGNGLGGRNQEMALAAAPGLAAVPDALLVCLATDGGDGPTDAAGAVVGTHTLTRAAQHGFEAAEHLRRNDAYPYFAVLDDLIKSGPTRTNVNDLAVLFLF